MFHNKIEDFVLFTLYPEMFPNSVITSNTAGIDEVRFNKNKVTLSADIGILCSVGRIVIPVFSEFTHIAAAIGLCTKVKINGERGQPCQHSHFILIFEKCLFAKISAFGFLYIILTLFIKLYTRPKLSKTLNREGHFTLLKAFSAFNDRYAASSFFVFSCDK